jgi:hypothetical protein
LRCCPWLRLRRGVATRSDTIVRLKAELDDYKRRYGAKKPRKGG